MNYLFAPYDLALLAKEKEFDELCLAHYDKVNRGTGNESWSLFINKPSYESSKHIAAPLWQQLVDWLYAEHKIFIQPQLYEEWAVYNRNTPKSFPDEKFDSLTAAIRHAFTLI